MNSATKWGWTVITFVYPRRPASAFMRIDIGCLTGEHYGRRQIIVEWDIFDPLHTELPCF